MSVRRLSASILIFISAGLLSGQEALALGSTVHAGQTCQALHAACIAKAAKAPAGSSLTQSACDTSLAKALATPVKSANPDLHLYLWPQMGASLPEKCSN